MFEKLNVPILGVIENMAGDLFGEGGGEQLAAERGVPFLGRVPLTANVRMGGDSGHPVVADDPDSPAGQAFYKLAQSSRRADQRDAAQAETDYSAEHDQIAVVAFLKSD